MNHGRFFIILTILFMIVSSLSGSRFVARIDQPDPAAFIRFEKEGRDICAYHPGMYLDLLLDEQSYIELQSEFPGIHVTQTEAQVKANLSSGSKDIPGYRTYTGMVTELMQLQAQYPSLIQVSTIGSTWGAQYAAQDIPAYLNYDHQIWAVKLSDNVQEHEDEPEFYFVGEHHAREPISLETVMGILTNLLEGYNTNTQITDLVNNSEIWFVPLLNPDGHKIVIDQTDVWWRKNLIDNNNNQIIDLGQSGNGADGTDLNRNYGYEWGYMSASGNPGSITYHGSAPFSEVETTAFKDFFLSHNFLAGIGYHSYGQYVLYPFGYMYDILTPEATEQRALAEAMAATIPSITGTGNYTPMPSFSLYPVSGSLDDWAYATNGTFAYTIEMATEFIPNATDAATIVQDNLTAAKLLLSRTNTKVLKGHVTDATTGLPLSALVFVHDIDDNPLKVHQTRSDSLYGSFWRFLPQGSHWVSYSCPGYITDTHQVQISASSATVEDIALLPVEPFALQIDVADTNGAPLSGAVLTFLDQEALADTTDAGGSINIPQFYPGIYRFRIACPGFEQLTRMENISSSHLLFTMESDPDISDSFETDLSLWQTTGAWGRSSSQAHSGTYSLADSPTGNYSANVNSSCRLIQPLNLVGATNANLQFYAKTAIALDGDYCELAWSNNGSTWHYLDHFNGNNGWQFYSYDLNHFLGAQLYLRFQMSSTNSANGDGIYIDDLKIFISSNPTPNLDELIPVPELTLNSYPNPFQSELSISISSNSKTTSPVCLEIYNIKGQLIKTALNAKLDSGITQAIWDGKDTHGLTCASGVYFLRLSSQNKTLNTRKIMLLK